MRHGARWVVAVLLWLGGCDEAFFDEERVAAPEPSAITAAFEPGGLVNVIVVTTTDRLPLRSAVLAGPDGARQPAYSLDVVPALIRDTSISADPVLGTRGVPSTTRVNIMRSTALIQLPDPVHYANTWRRWRIELRLGDPAAGERDVTLAAPAPPA